MPGHRTAAAAAAPGHPLAERRPHAVHPDQIAHRRAAQDRCFDFEDAALGDPSWARLPVTVGVTEELGTEIHVIFTIDAPPVEHAAISSATERHEEEDEAVAALAGGKSLWTARVSARSAARSGQPLQLAVDTTRLHFFDPASGHTIGHPLATGAEVSESASMR